MNVLKYTTGNIVERNPAVFMRQITGTGPILLVKSDIISITYDVWIVQMTKSRYQNLFGTGALSDISILPSTITVPPEPVVQAQTLIVDDVMFDTPQLDPRWDEDEIGYNFLATLDGSNFPLIDLDVYPNPVWQEVWFTFTPVSGDPFVEPYILQVDFSLAGR